MMVTAVLLGRIGDVIVATPILRALRRRYPQHRLRLILNDACAGLAPMLNVDEVALLHRWPSALKNLPLIASLGQRSEVAIDLNPSPSKSSAALMTLLSAPAKIGFRKGRFDGAYTSQIDAPGVEEPMIDRYARLATHLGADFFPQTELKLGAEDRLRAAQLLESVGFSKSRVNVAVHPGNFKKFDNRWPEANFAALTDRLLDNDRLSLYYVAGPGEREPVQAIVSALKRPVPILPAASLPVTAAMLSSMNALLCNITGTTHLAAAVGVATFGLYSRYTDRVWRPRVGRAGGIVSAEWESCRSIPVDQAHARFDEFLTQICVG
jgi:heptosyltransferase II